jgi:hypothetical protein
MECLPHSWVRSVRAGRAATHPCAGRSQAAVEAFERIAVSQPPMCSPQTIQALLRAGLIEQTGERVLGRDALGPIRVATYEVPLPIHIQWCAWCDENVADEEVA